METLDRIPRDLLRVRLRELKPGEGTWIHRHDVSVCENGRVFVDGNTDIWGRAFNSWEREPRDNCFYVERTTDGWRMHLLARDQVAPNITALDAEKRKGYFKVTEVVVHQKEDKVCPCCQGAGITNLSGKEAVIWNAPAEVLRRIEAQLVRLEGRDRESTN